MDSLGKVRWFDPVQQHGVIDAHGKRYFFRRTGADRALPPLAENRVVMFREAGSSRLGPTATDVRPTGDLCAAAA